MRAAFAGLVAGVMLFWLPAPALAWDEAGYWEFADKLARRLDDTWSPALDRYRPGSGSIDSMMNANMLLLHSAAALYGHEGAARQDARARSIVAQAHEHAALGGDGAGSRARQPAARARLGGVDERAAEPAAPGGRRRGHRRAGDGVAGARRARARSHRAGR